MLTPPNGFNGHEYDSSVQTESQGYALVRLLAFGFIGGRS